MKYPLWIVVFLLTTSASVAQFKKIMVNPANSNKTAWGIIPIATWDPASTIEINVAGAEMNTASVPASMNINQNFGNLKWNTPALLSGNISLNSLV